MIQKITIESLKLPTDIKLDNMNFTKDGCISPLELKVIVGLVKKYNPKIIMEFGTFLGHTTINMAINQSEGSELYTVDLPKSQFSAIKKHVEEFDKKYINKDVIGGEIEGKKIPGRIIQIHADTADFDFSPFKDKIDFMFVDAAHSYEYVHSDTSVAFQIVKRGGIIIWHDYSKSCWPGLNKAMEEISAIRPEIRHIENTSICILGK